MRRLLALTVVLLLVGAGCGGGGSPLPIYGSPGVTSPAQPLGSPAGSAAPGY